MTCSACDGSGVLFRIPADGGHIDCPECSAEVMRAERDEARARAERAEASLKIYDELPAVLNEMNIAEWRACAIERGVNEINLRRERDEARAKLAAAESKLAALHSAPPERFPVLRGYSEPKGLVGMPSTVPWAMLTSHEPQAQRNHGQSLRRLAERGGLGGNEMLAVLDGVRSPMRQDSQEDADELRRRVEAFEGTASATAQRDAARTALAALLDALRECQAITVFVAGTPERWCGRPATHSTHGKTGEVDRCEEHSHGKRPFQSAILAERCSVADAIEAAERVLGRRGT